MGAEVAPYRFAIVPEQPRPIMSPFPFALHVELLAPVILIFSNLVMAAAVNPPVTLPPPFVPSG